MYLIDDCFWNYRLEGELSFLGGRKWRKSNGMQVVEVYESVN